jgi:hypothetical protein
MNTAEKIVEAYFRHVKGCLTAGDIKIPKGNNRQIDLLAWHNKDKVAYHVETSVAASGRYFNKSRSWKKLIPIFQNKFFALPKESHHEDYCATESDPDFSKLIEAYAKFGFAHRKVNRVFVCWAIEDYDMTEAEIVDFFGRRNVPRDKIQVIGFRDVILPALMKEVGSSNFEDDVLRTFSLLNERKGQVGLLD